MTYYLAVDIGASSGRHIVAHMENGRMITEEIYRFENGPTASTRADGERRLMWDIDRLYTEILNGLRRAHELGKEPVAVGIDTWGVDYVLLDGNDRPIEGAYCYRDMRGERAAEKVHAIIPFSELYRKTGIMYNSFNTVYQLYDDVLTGRIKEARSLLMIPDYFHFRLTGVKRQEYTNATTGALISAETHTWDTDILDRLGIPRHLFAEPATPGETVGSFTDEVAAYVGYRADIVLPCTHDTASAVLAAPLKGRTPYISSGTWSLLGVEQPQAYTSAQAEAALYSNEGTYDRCVRLQKNIMGLWMIQQVRHETGDAYDFATIAAMARENPIPETVPVDDPRFLAPVSMTDEIHAAVGRTLTLGETAYCVYNSLAKDYKESLCALEELTGEQYETLNIIGGGSKNALLNEMTARYTGKRVITGPAEGTAIGNLMMQMIGRGDIASVEEGRAIVARSFDIDEVVCE
ncbi:MAG: rhamnulokinase [Clostridia bacterium]|nr:rhamnulokinase [Clostridia bacterium]